MIRHEDFLELAATAIDFPLSRADHQRLDAHLTACATCARSAAGLRLDAAGYADLPPVTLPERRGAEILHAAMYPATTLSPVRLVAVLALLALLLLGAFAVGAEVVRRTDIDLSFIPPAPSATMGADASPGADASGQPAIPVFAWGSGSTVSPDGDVPSFTAVAAGGGGFVAVGGRNGYSRVGAWRSDDGAAWEPASGDALLVSSDTPMDDEPLPGFADVAWGPRGFVGVGIDMAPNGARFGATWHSSDGTTWTRGELPDAATTRPAAVTWNGSVYVIVGVVREDAPRGAAWLSSDGSSWRRAPDAAFDVGGYITYYSALGSGGLADVAAGADGSLVAVGHACRATTKPEEQKDCHPIAVGSSDGESWSRIEVPATTGVGLSSVTVLGTRRVAVAGGPGGMAFVQAPGPVAPVADIASLAVGDDRGFRLVEVSGVPRLERVVTFGDHVLAVSMASNRITLWASRDGEAWTEIPGLPQPPVVPDWADGIPAFADVDLVEAGDRLVIVGRNQGGRTGSEQFSIVGTVASAP